MNLKESIALRKFISSQEYNESTFNLNHIFKVFSTYCISSTNDFAKAPLAFLDFITNNEDCINFASEEMKTNFHTQLPKFMHELSGLFKSGCALKHDAYTIASMTLAPNKAQTKILEVGAGSVPYSSISIARHIKDVSSIDKLIVSPECLERFNVKGIDGLFDSNTDVDNYDFIIGQRPCSAFEDIVKSASINNKPYFLQLCNCELEHIAKRDGVYRSWQQILSDYDPNIRFYDTFAFNADVTPKQVSKILGDTYYKAFKLNYEGLITPEYQTSDESIIFDFERTTNPVTPEKSTAEQAGKKEDFEDFLLSIN